jgi:hypothetical protein
MQVDPELSHQDLTPSLLKVLCSARQAVPAVDYALGVAGIAAAAALVTAFIGSTRTTLIILGAMLIAMILLFVFARLVAARNRTTVRAGVFLLCSVVAFFCAFLLFTITAVAISWPPAWVSVLGLPAVVKGSESQSGKSLGIDTAEDATAGPCSPVVTGNNAKLVFKGNCNQIISKDR